MIAPRPIKPRPRHRWRYVLALLAVLIAELLFFNMPHYRSLAFTGNHPSSRSSTAIGSGLERNEDGTLTVTEPTKAYIEVDAVGTKVGYVHVVFGDAQEGKRSTKQTGTSANTTESTSNTDDTSNTDAATSGGSAASTAASSASSTASATSTASPTTTSTASSTASSTATAHDKVSTSVQVRLDALTGNADDQQMWDAGKVVTVREGVAASTYISSPQRNSDSEGLRLWIQEPTGSTISIKGLDINPRVPFHVSPLRVTVLAIIAIIILAFLPHSWLWRTRLRTEDRKQRMLLCGLLSPFALLALSIIVGTIVWPGQQIFHNANGYTYDFNQYGYIADALLHGRPWLDLKVPDQLLLSRNPLNIDTRQQLLDQGVQPLYWDYVLFEGRWYSYFGVLPAIVLFLPYQAITSLWVPGGLMLPAEAANALLLFTAMVLMIMLVIRVIKRHYAAMPLAVVALGSITLITASNMVYLWHKANFYTVPFAASLVLSTLGLWIWLGARRVNTAGGTRMWRFTDIQAILKGDATATLSLKRVALGSLCLGANAACRPPFILACLLAIPIFWDELVSLLSVKHVKHRYAGTISAGKRVKALSLFAASAVLPAATTALGALAYNFWRFGSPLDFGNLNQMTVVDLQEYQTPLGNIPYVLGYYLAQPPSLGGSFPWIGYAPAPLPHWQYTESGVGGILLLCPVLIVLLLLPSLRRTLRSRRLFSLACSLPALGVLIIVFDAYVGGFVWRYMADFGWLLGLGSVMVIAAVAERRDGANPRVPDLETSLPVEPSTSGSESPAACVENQVVEGDESYAGGSDGTEEAGHDSHHVGLPVQGRGTATQSGSAQATRADRGYHIGCARGLAIGLMTVLVLVGAVTSLLAGVAISIHTDPDAYAQMQSWFMF